MQVLWDAFSEAGGGGGCVLPKVMYSVFCSAWQMSSWKLILPCVKVQYSPGTARHSFFLISSLFIASPWASCLAAEPWLWLIAYSASVRKFWWKPRLFLTNLQVIIALAFFSFFLPQLKEEERRRKRSGRRAACPLWSIPISGHICQSVSLSLPPASLILILKKPDVLVFYFSLCVCVCQRWRSMDEGCLVLGCAMPCKLTVCCQHSRTEAVLWWMVLAKKSRQTSEVILFSLLFTFNWRGHSLRPWVREL